MPIRLSLMLVGPACIAMVLWRSLNQQRYHLDVEHVLIQDSRFFVWVLLEAAWFVHSIVQAWKLGRPQPPLSKDPRRYPLEERTCTAA